MERAPAITNLPRRPLVLATGALAAVLFVLPLLTGTPLLDPDEGLHAAIAQEMVERGDWITPRLLGEPFLDKPILFFWALAASIAAFPDGEFAVKLPGLAFGALGALATALIAARWFGRRAGLLGFLAYATLLLPMALTQGAVHDVALVPWTALAMLALWDASAARTPAGAARYGALAGLWLGLATLTKALTGVVLVGLPFFVWTLLSRRLTLRLMAAGALSLAVAGLVAWPWYSAMEAANPGYLHYYFVERHLMGYATSTQLHGSRAWWYYLPVLVGGGLPWLPYALATLRPLVRDRAPALLLAWTWLVVDVLFLSLAGSKLLTYLLPAFPAVALLAAAAWDRALREDAVEAGGARRPAWRALHLLALLPLAAILPGAAAIVAREAGIAMGFIAWTAMAVASLGWLAATVVGLTRGRAQALTAIATSWVVTALVALLILLPAIAPAFSARALARHYNQAGRLPAQLWFYAQRVGSFIYYLDPPLRASLTRTRVRELRPDEVLGMRQAPPDVDIIVSAADMPKLDRRLRLSAQPSVPAGQHRIFEAATFVAAVRAATGER